MTVEQNESESHPTRREWFAALAATRDRLMKDRPRAFAPGTTRKCPACGKRALSSREDLLREVVVGSMALIHHNLHGARCQRCGAEFLESYEEISLEEFGAARHLADYAARVTSVSGKNLGTYWPKDVVRVMDLHKEDALSVQVLDRDTMLLQRKHSHE